MTILSFDLETHLFQPGLRAPPPVCGSSADDGNAFLHTRSGALALFKSMLRDGAHVVGCNLPYDAIISAAYGDPEIIELLFQAGDEDRLHDISVREALHDIAINKLFIDYETGEAFAKRDPVTGEMSGRYSMKILMKRHFKLDIIKTGGPRTGYARLEVVPQELWSPEERDYPKRDARYTLDIFHSQRGHYNLHNEAAQVRAAIGLQLMHVWGLRTDRTYVLDLEKTVDAEWDRARAEFMKAGIYRADGTKDTKALAAMVTVAYGGKPPTAPKGGVSGDRDTLEESGDPVLMKLAGAGKNDKRKTIYIPVLKEGFDFPLNPEFNVLVATGRISSDFQQLPQKGGIREGIVSRGHLRSLLKDASLPNTVLVSCDYEGLELRTMAQRAIWDPDVRFSKMAELLNQGMDVHTYTAATFLGCTYEALLARVKAKDPIAVAYRSLAKIFNFGKGGGMGAAAMAFNARAKDRVSFCLLSGKATKCGTKKEKCRVQGKWKMVCSACVQVSKELGEKWLKAWPEQGKLFRKAGMLTNGGKTVTSINPYSKRARGDCIYTQWLNDPFQGMGGDGVKLAQWRIQREMYANRHSPLWGSRLVLNVHDELIAEILEERLHEASYLMADIMIRSMNEVTPDVKNNVEPAACRRLFKSASTTKTEKGLLKPWWNADTKTCGFWKDVDKTGHRKVPTGQHHAEKCGCWKWEPDQEAMTMDLAA